MKPSTRIYTINVENEGHSGDFFYLKTHEGMRFLPCNFMGDEDRSILLHWMTRKELIAWFRRAADLIEKANFE